VLKGILSLTGFKLKKPLEGLGRELKDNIKVNLVEVL
jgi:hypothetical protein